MTYKMYIDDIRTPKVDGYVLVRSTKEAIEYIRKNGYPSFVSFDHDLGMDDDGVHELPSGYDFAKWLCDEDHFVENFMQAFDYFVHSANPVGKANIEGYLENYMSFKGYK